MDPVTAAAAVTVVSGIVQAYNAEKARGANKKRLNELRAMFEKIVPPEYDMSIDTPPKYIEQQLQAANFDFSRLTPQEFKLVGQYAPEAAQYVAEKNPELLKGSAAQKEGRQAQLDALRQMQSIAKGDSPELGIMLQQAKDKAAAAAQSRQQSVMQDFARRGQGGSGANIAAALTASGQSMAQGAMESQNAALAAYRDKLNAIQNAGQMGRQLSADELMFEEKNNDVINAFNQRSSRAYQDYLNQRAQLANEAKLRNLQAEQAIANQNVAQRNEYDRYNLENRNRLAQQVYGNQRDERNYQNDLAYRKADWDRAQRARLNDLKSRQYGDQMTKAQAMSGIYSEANRQENQSAQDRNAMINSIGQAGSGYFSGQAQAQAQKEAQDREDARWDRYLVARGYKAPPTKSLADSDEDEYRSNYFTTA